MIESFLVCDTCGSRLKFDIHGPCAYPEGWKNIGEFSPRQPYDGFHVCSDCLAELKRKRAEREAKASASPQ